MKYESSKKSKTYFKYIDAVYSVTLQKLMLKIKVFTNFAGTIFKFQS